MRAVETIKNIWKIEDLRNRILTTLLLVAIYRFGTYVVLPGIDPKALTALQEQTRGGLLALLDICLLYTSPSPRDVEESRMPSSA